MKRLSAPPRNPQALLAGLLVLLAFAACTGSEDEPGKELTYEEAKAQVPLDGSDREPLFWQVEPFSDADAAEAAEAVQHYIAVFDILSNTHPIDAEFFSIMSHFATDERITETRGWFPGPRSPSAASNDYTGPRWMWVMDVSTLRNAELGVTVCVDGGWYGYHPDGVFKEVDDPLHQAWGLRGYILRQEDDAETSRWKVHDTMTMSAMLPEAKVEPLREACIAWATHDWEGN
jgi:hypothetical protein